ncbi:hypothetical protein Tco_0537399 [Tanacetum coccineum]
MKPPHFALVLQKTSGTYDGEVGSSRSKRSRNETVEEVREAESEEKIFTSVAWIRSFNINEPIYAQLCHEFYSTYEFDETSKWICECSLGDCKIDEEKRSWTQKESQICYGQFISKLARKCRVLTEDVVRSLSAPIYCRDLDTTTLRDLISARRIGAKKRFRISIAIEKYISLFHFIFSL